MLAKIDVAVLTGVSLFGALFAVGLVLSQASEPQPALNSAGQVEGGGRSVLPHRRNSAEARARTEIWAKLQAKLILAQGRCPVVDEPLPKDSAWTVVGNRIIFVCCKPCTAKIEADPEKYSAAVDALVGRKLLARNAGTYGT